MPSPDNLLTLDEMPGFGSGAYMGGLTNFQIRKAYGDAIFGSLFPDPTASLQKAIDQAKENLNKGTEIPSGEELQKTINDAFTFQDNLDLAINNPAELTKEEYENWAKKVGDIQRSDLNLKEKTQGVSELLTDAGIFHDPATLDILGQGSDTGGLLSKRIKIVEKKDAGGTDASASNTGDLSDITNEGSSSADDLSDDIDTSITSDVAGADAAIEALSNAGTMAQTVNPFEGNTGGDLIFDGTNFVQNIEVDGDEYSRLVPDVLARQLQEAIAAETDPEQKAALTNELAKYMEGTGNTVDTVNPMIVETYGIQTNTISPSQIANGSDVDWKVGDKIAVLGVSDDKYLLEHISSTTNQVGNKSKTKDEQMDEQINNFLNGRLNWADIKIIAEQIYGAGTQQANNAVITASEKAQEQDNKAAAQAAAGQQAALAKAADQQISDGNTDTGLQAGAAAAGGQLANDNVAGVNPASNVPGGAVGGAGAGAVAGGVVGGNASQSGVVGDQEVKTTIDPQKNPDGGTGIGVGTGIGSGSGPGDGEKRELLNQVAASRPLNDSIFRTDLERIRLDPTGLMSRLFI